MIKSGRMCAHEKNSSICFVHIWCDYLAFLFYILFQKIENNNNKSSKMIMRMRQIEGTGNRRPL